MTILSVDLGRTATKSCVDRRSDRVVLIPANVARLGVDRVRRGGFDDRLTNPLLDLWLEHQGNGYALGQLAADFGANLGVGQSKVEDALVKVLACVGYFQLRGKLALVIGLPYLSQEQFDLEKNQLASLLASPHVFAYRGEAVSIEVEQVWIVPEGYGSFVWCDAVGAQASTGDHGDLAEFPQKSVAVIDIGHQTTDFLAIDRYRFARGASRSEPFAMSQFYNRVAQNIPNADSQSLALIEAVNRPEGRRWFRPRGEGQPTNLDEMLPNLRKSFARELSQRIVEWLPERVTDAIVSGGGGEFFWEDLKTLLSEAGLQVHLASPSRQANALGQSIYAEALARTATQQAA